METNATTIMGNNQNKFKVEMCSRQTKNYLYKPMGDVQ